MADWPVAVGGSLQGLQSLLAILALLSQGEAPAPRTPPTALLEQLAMLRSLQQPETRMNLSLKPGTMQMPAATGRPATPPPDPGMGPWPPANETPLAPYRAIGRVAPVATRSPPTSPTGSGRCRP